MDYSTEARAELSSELSELLRSSKWKPVKGDEDMRRLCMMGMVDVPENENTFSGSADDFQVTEAEPIIEIIGDYLARNEFYVAMEDMGLNSNDAFIRFDLSGNQHKGYTFVRTEALLLAEIIDAEGLGPTPEYE